MSLLSHTLYEIVDGVPNELGTLEELGVLKAIVGESSQGDVAMELTVSAPMDGSQRFTEYARHELVDPAGIVRAVGWLMKPPRAANGNSEQHLYQFAGPWDYFFRWIYKAPAHFAVDPTNPTSTTLIKYVTIGLSNYNASTGDNIPIVDQISAALTWAQLKEQGEDPLSGALPAVVDPAFTFDVTDVPDRAPVQQEFKDQTVSTIVRNQMRWWPTGTSNWTFGALGAPPALKFVGVYPAAKTVDIRDNANGLITDFKGTKLFNLMLRQVRITYEGENIAGSMNWRTHHADTSTVDNGSPLELELTTTLPGSDGSTGWVPDDPPDGLASQLHDPFKTVPYEMEWKRTVGDVDWSDRPGEKWNALGAGAGFESAGSMCQQIVRDIGAGTLSYKCGLAAQLTLSDLLQLLQRMHTVAKGATAAKKNALSSGHGGGGGGGGGGISVADSEGIVTLDNVRKITFEGFNATVVAGTSGGEAVVKILPDPVSGTKVLGNVDEDVQWIDTTEDCP